MEMFGKTLGEIQDEFRDESEKASEVCHIVWGLQLCSRVTSEFVFTSYVRNGVYGNE